LEVGGEEGEGSVKIVDGFEVQITFVAYRKGMVTADNSLGFIVYLERKREERVHHGDARRGKLEDSKTFFRANRWGPGGDV
jgi:hypothetical protein